MTLDPPCNVEQEIVCFSFIDEQVSVVIEPYIFAKVLAQCRQ